MDVVLFIIPHTGRKAAPEQSCHVSYCFILTCTPPNMLHFSDQRARSLQLFLHEAFSKSVIFIEHLHTFTPRWMHQRATWNQYFCPELFDMQTGSSQRPTDLPVSRWAPATSSPELQSWNLSISENKNTCSWQDWTGNLAYWAQWAETFVGLMGCCAPALWALAASHLLVFISYTRLPDHLNTAGPSMCPCTSCRTEVSKSDGQQKGKGGTDKLREKKKQVEQNVSN